MTKGELKEIIKECIEELNNEDAVTEAGLIKKIVGKVTGGVSHIIKNIKLRFSKKVDNDKAKEEEKAFKSENSISESCVLELFGMGKEKDHIANIGGYKVRIVGQNAEGHLIGQCDEIKVGNKVVTLFPSDSFTIFFEEYPSVIHQIAKVADEIYRNFKKDKSSLVKVFKEDINKSSALTEANLGNMELLFADGTMKSTDKDTCGIVTIGVPVKNCPDVSEIWIIVFAFYSDNNIKYKLSMKK